MDARLARRQRILLWGGLLEPAGAGGRTVRDWVVDSVIFVVAVLSGAFVLASTWDAHSPAVAVLDVMLGSIACLALWFRRERPLQVALVAVTLSSVSALAGMATLPAVFNAAIRLPLGRLAGVTALAAAGTAILPLLYPEVDGHGYGWQLSVGLLLTAVALGWGLFVRAQRELLRGMRVRAEDEAREAERRRIAREMHDVLAHRLSLLSVHAGALENAGSRLPPEYVETAGVIRSSARLALEELRAVIGLLRAEAPGAPPEPPQPTLEQIPALVEESRSAGMAIDYREDIRTAVPLAVGRTAYRAVQEGLTNARKHAGGEPVELTLGAGDGPPLVVELVTRGSARLDGAAALPGSGTGLIGLAERVELAGGEVSYGPDAEGNFVLRATVPWAP
jgi:signal transduction histidine kinase